MMTEASTIQRPARMYNRLFWIDWISRLWVVGSALVVVWLIIQTVLHCLPGALVDLTLPIQQNDPPHAGDVSYGGGPYAQQGAAVTFTEVRLTVSHLPIVNAILLGLGDILATATTGGLAWCLFILIRKVREDQPFAASTARALTAAGIILAVGSTASTLVGTLGKLGLGIMYASKLDSSGILFVGGDLTIIQFAPLFFAAVLFALAGVFRYGARLQRETEGLV